MDYGIRGIVVAGRILSQGASINISFLPHPFFLWSKTSPSRDKADISLACRLEGFLFLLGGIVGKRPKIRVGKAAVLPYPFHYGFLLVHAIINGSFVMFVYIAIYARKDTIHLYLGKVVRQPEVLRLIIRESLIEPFFRFLIHIRNFSGVRELGAGNAGGVGRILAACVIRIIRSLSLLL